MNREKLIADLNRAVADEDATLSRLVSFEHGSRERVEMELRYNTVRNSAAAIRRELATVTGEEHAVWLDLGVRPEAAISGAVLIQTESRCYLIFNASNLDVDGRAAQAIAEFKYPRNTRFGAPNDEALSGHPLYGRGLQPYDAFEVINSRWLVEELRQNQVAFPNYEFSCRHFIFTFHDSSFECLAEDLSVTVDERPFDQIWHDLYAKVNEL
ncbi:hypothetical protein Mal52_56460 [Symmachiella dynata]|uniref:Uncharacterized protein n=1 Tax=Symmachiella dynata TaxID=2527995 RepID=A0A517ZXC4_9PLAN|nr:hypothetical protein [Symmachiella dynata]QDU47118.1 hypothetical protein Mal52_56460 [Symmachiella dynata]